VEGGGTGGSETDASVDQLVPTDADACQSGDPCGDGGICAGGECCSAEKACGDACCDTAQVCSFQVCVTPGTTCKDSTDCASDEYCEYALGEPVEAGAPEGGCTGGATQLEGKCLPRPPECSEMDGGAPDGGPLTCLESCQWIPPTTDFEAEVKYAWGGMTTPPYDSDVMMSPIVVQLDDDDCDGKITANDIPEIVFATFSGGAYTQIGTVHAISIVDGQVVDKWSTPGLINAASELAGGNFDGQPGNEIVGCGSGMVVALDANGAELWRNEDGLACRVPLIANLDGTGAPEVVVEGGILDGVTGATKHTLTSQRWAASDLDGDGELDLVGPQLAVHADGTQFVDTGMAGTFNAIGDFDLDGTPEVVAVDSTTHTMWLWHYDAAAPGGFAIVRGPVDINGTLDPSLCAAGSAGSTRGGGPPTVADFNGDNIPDVALAGGVGYAIFDGAKLINPAVAGPDTFLWVKQTRDCSSAATGSSIFDFNGDGQSEVVYSDEIYFRIYEGTTGDVLWETCNTTGTLIEYPLVADVDNDGQADIVVASNAYAYSCNGTKQSGIRVFGSANGTWVRTRRTWNQHTYHVTNIQEDGTVPQHELPNWTQPGLNNFRQNKQPGSEFAAPDAVVDVAVVCAPTGIAATVRNVGEAAMPPGLEVTFYFGDPPSGTELGTGTTTKTLYSAQSEVVTLSIGTPPAGMLNGTTPVYATVTVPDSVHECRPDNNTSAPATAQCGVPK
jgi:FG-GAP-like repeat